MFLQDSKRFLSRYSGIGMTVNSINKRAHLGITEQSKFLHARIFLYLLIVIPSRPALLQPRRGIPIFIRFIKIFLWKLRYSLVCAALQ